MEKKIRGGLKTPINEATLIPQVAALLAVGKTNTNIAQQLSVGYNTIKRISNLDATKAMIKDISDSAMTVAKAVIKQKVSESVELACEVLMEHLKEERSLDAVKLVFKVSGALADEPVTQGLGNQSMTIIMPGASAEKPSIEVPNEEFVLEVPDEM